MFFWFGWQIVGTLIDSGQVKTIIEEFKQVLVSSDTRKKERVERSHSEDFDAEEGELLQEENEQEEQVFDQACEKTVHFPLRCFTLSNIHNWELYIPSLPVDWGMHWNSLENIQRSLSSFIGRLAAFCYFYAGNNLPSQLDYSAKGMQFEMYIRNRIYCFENARLESK